MKHLKTFETFLNKTVHGTAPLIEVIETIMGSKFDAQLLLEYIEQDDLATYRQTYITELDNEDKMELVDLIESQFESNVEFILDIEICDLCIVLGNGGRDLHIDVSEVDREQLHKNYMSLYNKYSENQEE